MASQEYLMALGENRRAFAGADYELVFFLFTIDHEYQRLVDAPVNRAAVVTSGRLAKDLRTMFAATGAPADLVAEAQDIARAWEELAERRNNLAHAWGYSDERGTSQLGGLSHKFPKDAEPIHTLLTWPVEVIRQMTADCNSLFGRVRHCRARFEDWRSSRS